MYFLKIIWTRPSPNSLNIKHSHTEKNGSAPREICLVLIQEETIQLTLPAPQAKVSHPLWCDLQYSSQNASKNSLMLIIELELSLAPKATQSSLKLEGSQSKSRGTKTKVRQKKYCANCKSQGFFLIKTFVFQGSKFWCQKSTPNIQKR